MLVGMLQSRSNNDDHDYFEELAAMNLQCSILPDTKNLICQSRSAAPFPPLQPLPRKKQDQKVAHAFSQTTCEAERHLAGTTDHGVSQLGACILCILCGLGVALNAAQHHILGQRVFMILAWLFNFSSKDQYNICFSTCLRGSS